MSKADLRLIVIRLPGVTSRYQCLHDKTKKCNGVTYISGLQFQRWQMSWDVVSCQMPFITYLGCSP